jgi:signal transduction histidine kinase
MVDYTFRCPSCDAGYSLPDPKGEEAPPVTCSNTKCDLPYRFSFFDDLDEAEREKQRLASDLKSWSKPYVFAVEGDCSDTWVLAHFNGQVRRFEPRSITDVVNLHALRGMLTGFGDENGCTFSIIKVDDLDRIEPVQMHETLADMLGIPEERRTPLRNYTPLCLELRNKYRECSSHGLPHPCEEFDNQIVGLVTGDDSELCSPYECPAGLYDFVYPIEVGGNVLAVLFSGQRRLDTPETEARLMVQLPSYSNKCGLSTDRALELLKDTPILTAGEAEAFKKRVLDTGRQIQEVAERNSLEIRKTRDQYFIEEVAGRIRQRMDDFITDLPKSLFCLQKTRLCEYLDLSHCSLLYTRAPESITFFRQKDGTADQASVDLAASFFTSGPSDRDGIICLFDNDRRLRLTNAIRSVTRDLPSPLFVLRIILEIGTQVLLVFHGASIKEMPAAYAPTGTNLYVRRSFFDRLSRTIQSELNIIQRYGNQQKALMSIMHTAHQPLDGILQIESMIRSDLGPNPLTDKWLRDIKHTAEHAQALCGCIARVFKCLVEQGSAIDQSVDKVNVHDVVKSIAKSMRLYEKSDRSTREPHRRGLTIEYLTKVRHLSVQADKETVLFVMYNLLHNAEKYSDLNSHITVEYSREGTQQHRLFVKVKSWGEPISDYAHRYRKPFELFWRGSNKKTGLGVGLWACQYLLERQGEAGRRGEIHLFPPDPDFPRLAVFGVRFPLVAKGEPYN